MPVRQNRSSCPLLLAALLVVATLGPAMAGEEVNPVRRAARQAEALARVGDQVITVDEFRAELERRGGSSPVFATPEGRRLLLKEMAYRKALLARAEAAGYGEHPEVVEVYERMVIRTYQRETLDVRLAELEVSSAEVEAYYAAHAEAYTRPARLQAAIVFYAVPAQASPEHRAELAEKADRARAEAATLDPSIRHFGPIARRDSNDRASRYQGGVVGWLSDLPGQQHRLEPEVVEAIFARTEPGEIAPVVETAKGFYLVRLVDRQEARPQPFERVASGIRHQLLREKRSAMRRAFEAELAAELGVEIDTERLEALELPPALAPPALPTPVNTAPENTEPMNTESVNTTPENTAQEHPGSSGEQ